MVIYSGFSHWKWWFSIAMLVHQRLYKTFMEAWPSPKWCKMWAYVGINHGIQWYLKHFWPKVKVCFGPTSDRDTYAHTLDWCQHPNFIFEGMHQFLGVSDITNQTVWVWVCFKGEIPKCFFLVKLMMIHEISRVSNFEATKKRDYERLSSYYQAVICVSTYLGKL